jgi:hypothetical protein
MRDNVKTFAEMASRAFSAPEPVLEIGSWSAEGQEGYAELRPFFFDKRYIGGDFVPGPNVLSFVQGLRSSVVYKGARRAGRLFRRL